MPPVEQRDLHALGWWLIERAFADDPFPRDRFAIAATVMRVLAGLGREATDEATASREMQLRALFIHGFQPRDEDEWRLAREVFDDDALALLATFGRLDEADRADGVHPLGRVERAADEVELTGVGEDEE